MTARYADRDEVFESGDAFYTPPGHVPVMNEPGTEILWFSPSDDLRTAEAVMVKNMHAMQDGSTPSWRQVGPGQHLPLASKGALPCSARSGESGQLSLR
jgi:hypothetical protein